MSNVYFSLTREILLLYDCPAGAPEKNSPRDLQIGRHMHIIIISVSTHR